jgi:hypothetical protein
MNNQTGMNKQTKKQTEMNKSTEIENCFISLNLLRNNLINSELVKSSSLNIAELSRNESGRKLFIEEGACEAIIDAVANHIRDKDVLTNCSIVLFWLCQNPEGVVRIKEKMYNSLSEESIDIILNTIDDLQNAFDENKFVISDL